MMANLTLNLTPKTDGGWDSVLNPNDDNFWRGPSDQ